MKTTSESFGKSLAWAALFLALPLCVPPSFAQVTIVPASPLTGPAECRCDPGEPPNTFCGGVPYDTVPNFAFAGNGFAQAAVALNNYTQSCPFFHQREFANDGYYGNGSSWISDSTDSWLKIDLGRVVLVDRVRFGRDRYVGLDDRDPGQFTIAVALSENVYADGDDSNDANEYVEVLDSADFGFSGVINGAETVQASFPPVQARFIKLTVQSAGAAVDEVEVLGTVAPLPAVSDWGRAGTALLLMAALLTVLAWRRRPHPRASN